MSLGPTLGSEFARRYRLDALLGRGGMSTVYRAWDKQLTRWVALKFPLPELAQDARFRQRFLRESRLAASIEHHNIIPIYDAGEFGGVLYIAMRYLDGTNLADLIAQEGRLDARRTLSILTQVGRALDAAHAKGLVHRDVKPANVLLIPRRGEDDGDDDVYLSDFGLSKLQASESGLTTSQRFVGTAAYVAPDQIEGGEVDGRTDLYSLGCVFYECLTGLPPFDVDNLMGLLWAHVHSPPPDLSRRRPDLPLALDTVLQRAMAKSRNDRFPTCAAFMAEARRALAPPSQTLPQPVAEGAGRSSPALPAGAEEPASAGGAPGPAGEGVDTPPPPSAPSFPERPRPPLRAWPLLAGAAVALAALLGVFLVPRLASPPSRESGGGSAVSSQKMVTFGFTGAPQTWTVPAGVRSATFHVFGAQGGSTGAPSSGGLGGLAFATLPVTPGSQVTIVVGGQGGSVAACQVDSPPGDPGFNGGGHGGGPACPGAGGGGASDVRIGGADLPHRVLVAGGGGGAAYMAGADGGGGGDLAGGTGLGPQGQRGEGGAGASQAPGSGSQHPGQGGDGVAGDPTVPVGSDGGGGGGGGYYGGAGGGHDAGGGGGSGYGPQGADFDNGVQQGNGMVQVIYNQPGGGR